jgi:hypothetical protein
MKNFALGLLGIVAIVAAGIVCGSVALAVDMIAHTGSTYVYSEEYRDSDGIYKSFKTMPDCLRDLQDGINTGDIPRETRYLWKCERRRV